MKIVIKRVGQMPEVKEVENKLSIFKKIVGGYIETTLIANDPIICVCNEEGKLKGLKPNFMFGGDLIVGDVFFCGVDEFDFAGLNDKQINWVMEVMTAIENVKRKRNKLNVT